MQAAVEARGLFYPPDPSSYKQSAIGGNVAENAGGARCLKYGVTSNYVQALEVVLPDGAVFRTGGKMVKNVTGYDLRALFTGSEGTLGTITEITLRLIPKPKFSRTAMATFAQIDDAARTVTAVMAAGLIPTSIELLDNLTMQCLEEFSPAGLPLDAEAILLFAVDGDHEAVLDAESAEIERIARANGARRDSRRALASRKRSLVGSAPCHRAGSRTQTPPSPRRRHLDPAQRDPRDDRARSRDRREKQRA